MASPITLREFRYKNSATMSVAFTNAAASSWNTDNSTKLGIVEFDQSGLTKPGLPNETIRTRMYGRGADSEGLDKGAYRIATHVGGAWANVDWSPEPKFMGCLLGGMQAPTNAKTGTVAATGTTTNIPFTSANTHCVAGMAALLGSRGDGRGNGEVKQIVSTEANAFQLGQACNAAPTTGDAVAFSHTVFPDEDASQQYIDTLHIGHATADQRQTIGGVGTVSLSQLGPGERPRLEYEMVCADHQVVAAVDRSALDHSANPEESTTPAVGGIGLFHLGDNGSTTRSALKAGAFSVVPGVTYEEFPDPAGPNGVGGYQRMPGVPMIEATVLEDEDAGLTADFPTTAKSVMMQFGTEQGRCFAVEMPKGYLDEQPSPEALGNFSGLKTKLHGEEQYQDGNDLNSAAIRFHWL